MVSQRGTDRRGEFALASGRESLWVGMVEGRGGRSSWDMSRLRLKVWQRPAGLCRRVSSSHVGVAWRGVACLVMARSRAEDMPRARRSSLGVATARTVGGEAGDEGRSGMRRGLATKSGVQMGTKAVCSSMRGRVMMRDSEIHHPCRSKRAIKAHQRWSRGGSVSAESLGIRMCTSYQLPVPCTANQSP